MNHNTQDDLEQAAKDSGFDNSDEAFMSAFVEPTPTQDNELFELCKEVYVKTRWERTKEAYYRQGKYNSGGIWFKPHDPFIEANTGKYVDFPYEFLTPLYTSDYLLEKLPESTTVAKRFTGEGSLSPEKKYTAWLSDDYQTWADTPLKALLKLTLALHKEGLL